MENQQTQPTPESIMQIGSGFWASKILLTAVNFGIFTKIAVNKTLSAQALKTDLNLKCTDRHFYDFLDVLVALGFLTREGILETAQYANSVNADFYLDKNKPTYIGGMLEMMNNRLYGFWGNLDEGLQTGEKQNEGKTGGELFELIYSDPNKLKEFISAMSSVQMGNFMAFPQKFDFSKYKTLTDVGGSAAMLSIMVAKNHPHMQCVSFDLPAVEPIAKATIEKFQLTNQVKTVNGNFFTDDFPKADIVVMGNILHDWGEETKLMLMKKAYDAIPENGVFVAIENVIDDERNKNVFGMMMSLNMLIETGTGFDYTFADFNKWAKQVGFKSTTIIPLVGPASAVVAYK